MKPSRGWLLELLYDYPVFCLFIVLNLCWITGVILAGIAWICARIAGGIDETRLATCEGTLFGAPHQWQYHFDTKTCAAKRECLHCKKLEMLGIQHQWQQSERSHWSDDRAIETRSCVRCGLAQTRSLVMVDTLCSRCGGSGKACYTVPYIHYGHSVDYSVPSTMEEMRTCDSCGGGGNRPEVRESLWQSVEV